MKKKLLLIILGLLMSCFAFSQTINQELICTTGETFTNSTYQLDWSIGECVTSTFSDGNFYLAQGFHQGIWTITSINDFDKDLYVKLYPNPTSDYIFIKFENTKPQNLKYTITDISGKIIKKNEINNAIESINVSNLYSGTFILSIIENNHSIKSFKLIKN